MSYCLQKSKYHSLVAVLAGYNLIYLRKSTQKNSASIQDGIFRKGGAKHIVYNLVSLSARGITLGKNIFLGKPSFRRIKFCSKHQALKIGGAWILLNTWILSPIFLFCFFLYLLLNFKVKAMVHKKNCETNIYAFIILHNGILF